MINEQQLLDKYYSNNASKLHSIVHQIMMKNKIYCADKDDFYSIANESFIQSLKDFNRKHGISVEFDNYMCVYLNEQQEDEFKRYLYTSISNRIKSEITKRNTFMRQADKFSISLDKPINEQENVTIGDTIASDFDMDKKLGFSADERVEQYLNSLSNTQRNMVEMKMNGYQRKEIKDQLGLTKFEYEDNMRAIKQNKLIPLFSKNQNDGQYRKVEQMKEKIEETLTMDLDTTDSYRTDKYTLYSLLESKKDGEINCHYISQRVPFVWDSEKENKFFSRILNNQPIPEIILCETIENNVKVSYLVEGLQRLSYAEAFKENLMPIRAKGAEYTLIKYKKYELDENGNKIIDQEGKPKFVIDTFDIVNKYYRDLPEFLQKRFNNFNITVTTFFNCTEEIINYHIRNYNNHISMTKAQYGITSVSNETSRSIKAISENHPFFKNHVKCSHTYRKKGVLDEVVARSIISVYFLDFWSPRLIKILEFIDNNVTQNYFEGLTKLLDRLTLVVDDSVKDLFNTTNTYIWFAVFHKFTKLNMTDSRFIEFMREFQSSLHEKKINGISYEDVNSRCTKDTKTVNAKINVITDLMNDYLQIEDTEESIAI